MSLGLMFSGGSVQIYAVIVADEGAAAEAEVRFS